MNYLVRLCLSVILQIRPKRPEIATVVVFNLVVMLNVFWMLLLHYSLTQVDYNSHSNSFGFAYYLTMFLSFFAVILLFSWNTVKRNLVGFEKGSLKQIFNAKTKFAILSFLTIIAVGITIYVYFFTAVHHPR